MKPISRILLVAIVSVFAAGLDPIPAAAATLAVNSSADPGDGVCDASCTLRDAILAADATPAEADTIVFDIPGAGNAVVINVGTSELPAIDHAVTIDGFSDPDSSRVEVHDADSTALAPADGLSINGSDVTVKGLVIRNFGNDGIDLSASASGNHIESNFIVTDINGTTDQGNAGHGVSIAGAANTVGGSGVGNVISGNNQNGVNFTGSTAAANVVQGNFIGTNATGTAALGNTLQGIVFTSSARDNTVGGTTASLRNIISSNGQDGVRIQDGATGNILQGNYIGTNGSGTGALPNSFDGVGIRTSAAGNTVGGTAAGAGNLISGNGQDGIQVGTTGDTTSIRNGLLGNAISANSFLGINLVGATGVEANDAGDGDAGPTNLQNYPVLTSAFSTTRVAVTGTLNSAGGKQYRIELFSNAACDPLGFGEGQTFIGATAVTTDAAGNASFSLSLPTAVAVGQVLTATATDPDNNTSEFSACKAVVADVTPPSTPTTEAGGTFQKDIAFTVSWSTATDNLSGILGYDVRYREAPYNGAFGGHVNWQKADMAKMLMTTTATSATFTGVAGTTYCFSARAIDGAGNASPYGAEGCTAVPVDNISFKHRGRWAKKSGTGYYLNTFSRTRQLGARLTLPAVQAKVLSIIVTKCRGCGTIKVFFKGTLLKKIRLHRKAAGRQQLRFVNLTTFASAQTGTVRITVVSRGKLVIVEGLGVSAA